MWIVKNVIYEIILSHYGEYVYVYNKIWDKVGNVRFKLKKWQIREPILLVQTKLFLPEVLRWLNFCFLISLKIEEMKSQNICLLLVGTKSFYQVSTVGQLSWKVYA